MEYNLEEIKEKEYNVGVIKHKYYKVLKYDGNEEKLEDYVQQLNEKSMFNIDYYIQKVEGNEAIIEKVIDTLD